MADEYWERMDSSTSKVRLNQGDLALALLGRGFVLIELNVAQDTVTVLTGSQTPISQMSELAQE
jgi:hypothetical protein